MGRVLAVVVGFLALLITALAFSVYATDGGDTRPAVDNLLAEAITRDIATSEDRGRPVDLAALTDFDWNRVLVVAKGTPPGRISRALGSEFEGFVNYDVESAEMFVFARGEQMIRYADYRGRARFVGLERPIAELAPEEAVFQVRDLVVRPAAAR